MSVDWRNLCWEEYQMRLWHWNDRHGAHEEPKIDPSRIRFALDSAVLH